MEPLHPVAANLHPDSSADSAPNQWKSSEHRQYHRRSSRRQ